MKVLLTAWYDSPNTYIKDLADFLMGHCEVLCSREVFWHTNIFFDIVHVQWPEQLFFGKKVTEVEVECLKSRISELKKRGTIIVATLHNSLPHEKRGFDKEIYDFVYNSADAIVNLGQSSTSYYPHKYNIVIPHPNYNRHIEILKNTGKNRFLCFGNIRSMEEELQIIKGFIEAEIIGSELIVLNSLVAKNPYGWRSSPFQKFKYMSFLNSIKIKNIKLLTGRVSHEDINHYFNWANYIISPRIHNLNSGVIYLGFSFGKLVIGPKVGNIGEVLENLGNPTFEPLQILSIAKAMKVATQASTDIGLLNKSFSDRHFSPAVIAEKHFNLYHQLLVSVK